MKLPKEYEIVSFTFKKKLIEFDVGQLKTKKLKLTEVESTMDSIVVLSLYFCNLKVQIESLYDKYENSFDIWKYRIMTRIGKGKKKMPSDKALERLVCTDYPDEYNKWKENLRKLNTKKRKVHYIVKCLDKRSDLLISIQSIRKMIEKGSYEKNLKEE